MPIITQIGIFVIVWWVVLFATLPLWLQGVTDVDDDELEPGIDPGAPSDPKLGQKFLLTTGIAFVVSAVLIAAIELGAFEWMS